MQPTIVSKVSAWIGKAITGIFVLAIIGIGIKSQIIVPWKSPNSPVSYSVFGDDGRSMQVVLLPDNRAIVWYDDDKHDYAEGNLVQWRGYVGTHYIWRIWNIGDNDSTFGPGIFGIRIYPEGVTPVVLDTEVLAHYIGGSEAQVLPNKGDRIRQQTVLIGGDTIRFQEMWLEKDDTSKAELDDDVANMLALLGPATTRWQN
ncbi:MAG TPA: hypothetical protein VFQ98_06140 [Gallionella sp.]|nr:hypothetical protein [Gallionella sp.]